MTTMIKMSQKIRKRLLFCVLVVIAFLGLSAVFNFILYVGFAGTDKYQLDLAGSWEVCAGKNSEGCSWHKANVPGSLPDAIKDNFDSWLIYKKTFIAPEACLSDSVRCELVLAEVGDAFEVVLNGFILGRHGNFPPKPKYTKHLPASIPLSPNVLQADGQLNQLILKVYSLKKAQAGIRRAPVAIMDSQLASRIVSARIFEFIILPSLAASGLIIFALISLAQIIFQKVKNEKLYFYVIFCIASALFLISFTEIPREYLPLTLASFVHFSLRTCFDWSFFEIVAYNYRLALRVKMPCRLFYLSVLLAFFYKYFFSHAGFDDAYLIMRLAFPLLLLPIIFALVLALKNSKQRYQPATAVFFAVLLPLQISDILVFHGFVKSSFYYIKFYPFLIGAFFGMIYLLEYFEENKKLFSLALVGEVAAQVSHDIRSPLAALKVMGRFLHEVPEEKRLLIRSAVQRIEDIANDLAGKKQEEKVAQSDTEKTSVYFLSSLIDNLISEKRLQFRSKINVNIRTELDAQSYGLFARLPLQPFKRVLSNLINNAVEAFENGGDIVVAMQNAGDNVVITVSDNGKGIPEDILPRLMQREATFGKVGGKGLGLFHARESVESWGGKIEITSCQTPHNAPGPSGTTVTLTLSRHEAPNWFVSELKISDTVVIFDDDNSIHQIWENRLVDAGFKKDKILHFTTTAAISEWYVQNKNKSPDYLFLLDYEILGDGKTGLDVIADLKIAPQAVLVTSHYEEEAILTRCQELGVKLLPKNLAGFVPIAFENKNASNTPIEYVLIDDQEMNHSTWQIIGRMKKKSVATFFNSESFFRVAATLDKNVKIYVDSDLGNGVKGEVISKEIADKGFSEIYLCTGFFAKNFGPMPWVKEIVGKKPPFMN